MADAFVSLFSFLVLLFIVVILVKFFAQLGRHAVEEVVEEFEYAEKALPYNLKRYFFTRSEREFFRQLAHRLQETEYRVFPKVRMGDFLEPNGEGREWWSQWGRIKSRHIDFLVWDMANGNFAAAIEVDGNSHRSYKNQEVDAFKDDVFESVGLELTRVRVGSDFASEIDTIVQKLKN